MERITCVLPTDEVFKAFLEQLRILEKATNRHDVIEQY